ncbi:23S rRNA (pseudouridine(1915)-N(3))-methyltransferase RlmH [Legionella impletisoli]|uniref:Ribosomal RNA large subunit methyltransferase H n=1 Tax=Legionella impletisoli TaxID=343510 RepID=A0A917JYE6_9GAMM|nr:23S rRNA (pseudouridine(1915)-N(3))-methyltransferase RlmH [Legionella impletisoli]GGI91395.1 ribosomal RNA large subunit methyltransferase H [Legionella impletisoli]
MLKITLITIGSKMPSWVDDAVKEFSKRLQDGITLSLIEIPLQKRGKSADISRILEKEKLAIEAAIPSNARLIALDIQGEQFTSEQLAKKLERLQLISSHLCFLIGGPEGLPKELIEKSTELWSLSRLTLPHTLARIVFLEAIYRAWSILNNHPYHK